MSGEWAPFHVLPLKSEHNKMTSHCVSTANQIQAEGYSHDRQRFHLSSLQNCQKLLLLKVVPGSWGQFSSLGGCEGYPIPPYWLKELTTSPLPLTPTMKHGSCLTLWYLPLEAKQEFGYLKAERCHFEVREVRWQEKQGEAVKPPQNYFLIFRLHRKSKKWP